MTSSRMRTILMTLVAYIVSATSGRPGRMRGAESGEKRANRGAVAPGSAYLGAAAGVADVTTPCPSFCVNTMS
jgi:hypothetical protein